ncbi:hypothetical protein RQP46_001680 [Phenoliferia psychrophenolica]
MSVSYITGPDLAKALQAGAKPGKDLAIVDVGALNVPSETHTNEVISDLADKLAGVPRVIFHCALSQVRGPTAARAYAQELERRAAQKAAAGTPTAAPKENQAATFALPNPYEAKDLGQEVLVLRQGFTGFQSLYKNDTLLVEKWDKGVWGQYSS